jgi:hypothetical protein
MPWQPPNHKARAQATVTAEERRKLIGCHVTLGRIVPEHYSLTMSRGTPAVRLRRSQVSSVAACIKAAAFSRTSEVCTRRKGSSPLRRRMTVVAGAVRRP